MRWLKLTGEILWMCLLPYRLIFRALPPLLRLVVLIATVAVIGGLPMMCSTQAPSAHHAGVASTVDYKARTHRPHRGLHRPSSEYRVDRSHLERIGYRAN